MQQLLATTWQISETASVCQTSIWQKQNPTRTTKYSTMNATSYIVFQYVFVTIVMWKRQPLSGIILEVRILVYKKKKESIIWQFNFYIPTSITAHCEQRNYCSIQPNLIFLCGSMKDKLSNNGCKMSLFSSEFPAFCSLSCSSFCSLLLHVA